MGEVTAWLLRRVIGAAIPAAILALVAFAEYQIGNPAWAIDALGVPLLFLGILAAACHLGKRSRW